MLVVEDIIDSGPDAVLAAVATSRSRGPASVEVVRAAAQAGRRQGRRPRPLRRLRHPQRVRRRLRPRLRRALPQPAVRRHARAARLRLSAAPGERGTRLRVGRCDRGVGDRFGRRATLVHPDVPRGRPVDPRGRRIGATAPRSMDVKRYFRGPFFWVVLVIVGVLLVASSSPRRPVASRRSTPPRRSTRSTAGKVDQAKIVDGDQRVELTLKDGDKIDGAGKVQTDYVQARQREIVDDLVKTPPSQGYTDSVPRTSWLVTLLINLLPILILASSSCSSSTRCRAAAPGSCSFGKSQAKLVSKDTPKITFADVAGADEAVEELEEIKEFLAEPGQVPGGRRQDPQGRAAVRPARHRQDAARPRGRRRGRRAVLLDLRLGLRRDVRRRRRQPRPRPVRAGQGQRARRSSSSTRSTPSAGTAAPASAAVTTSASRPSTSCSSRWTASTSRAASS